MVRVSSKAALLAACCILFLVLAAAADYGRSVDDMVGVFSIEKSIRLNSCPMGAEAGTEAGAGEKVASWTSPQTALESFNIDPSSVDTTEEGKPVEIMAQMAVSGEILKASFASPSGAPLEADLSSEGEGLYSGTLYLSPGSEPGVWRLMALTVLDGSGSQKTVAGEDLKLRGFPTELWVTSVDRVPPSLLSFDFEPKLVDGGLICFELEAADASGLGNLTKAVFKSPSGNQLAEVAFAQVDGGLHTGLMILPEDVEPGAWLLRTLVLEDGRGNRINLSRSDLLSMDLPAEFLVNRRGENSYSRIILP